MKLYSKFNLDLEFRGIKIPWCISYMLISVLRKFHGPMTSTFWDTNGWTDKGKSISADALQMILLMFCFFVLPGCVDPDVHVIHVTSQCSRLCWPRCPCYSCYLSVLPGCVDPDVQADVWPGAGEAAARRDHGRRGSSLRHALPSSRPRWNQVGDFNRCTWY